MRKLKASETALIMALPIESQMAFENAGIEVHYCGIGKINAAFKATEVILNRKIKNIINLGTAGSHRFDAHAIVECVGFVQRDMDVTALGAPLGITPLDTISGKIEVPKLTNYLHGICGTGDLIEIGKPRLVCDVVDMEAYAIAKVCRKLEIGFHAFKYITDASDGNVHRDWTANLKKASVSLLELYRQIIE